MNETLDYLRTFAAFPFAARRFLAQPPMTVAQAEDVVRERLAQREENFLALIERSIYGWPASPYLALLKHAGYTLADVRAAVRQKGLEGALRQLREAGVYVSFEEFKGRQPIRRGSLELPAGLRQFDNPFAQRLLVMQSSGSTGLATTVGLDLDHVVEMTPHHLLTFAAHGLTYAPTAIWRGTIPDSTLRPMLMGVYQGNVPRRWFSPHGWFDSKHWFKYGAATLYQILVLRLLGVPVPVPEPVKLEQALVIARWAAAAVRAEGACVIRTSVSRALRICLAAEEAGLDLTGVALQGGGEPPTPEKLSRIRRSGARLLPNYSMVEAGRLGAACAHPLDGSDVHLYKDAFALFAHPFTVEGFDVDVPAFNLTALLPGAPKVMLNVQMDDFGVVEERECGCALGALGYTTHLRDIRSYSKLTGEGVTLIGSEALRVLEETLPQRFGGSPLDYQLVEQEDEQGFTRLYLVISPTVPIADEQAVVDTLLAGLSQSSAMADAARMIWQASRTVQVRRAEPVWTSSGKVKLLHVQRRVESLSQGNPR